MLMSFKLIKIELKNMLCLDVKDDVRFQLLVDLYRKKFE